MDTTARDLFEKLKGQFKNLTLGKEDGTRTLIPGETSFFEFDYHNDESKLGSVVVSLVDEGSLKVYFATNIMDDADSESKDNWYGFLRGLRKFATQNMLNYEAKNISKQRLDKGDFEYLSKQNKTEEELTMESKLYGSRQKSYQDLNGAKLIVQHTKTVDEDKMGSRSRNIRAVYIENSDGERFKFENNYLPGARAMARHVSNGGYPRDEFGTHISEIMSEMSELRTFVRGVKGKDDYINEDAKDIIEKATGRYYGLKSTLESVSKQRGYTDYFENYEPTTFEVSEDDINDLKQKLTREVFDSKLENSLGAVGKAMKYNDQLQEKKSDGEYNDYPQWEKAAKREKADIIDGNIEDLDNKQEVTMYKIAMSGDEELGAWIQYQKDLDDPKVGQSVTIPGYGEFAAQAGVGDRGETDEREFIVPDSLELSPGGTPLSSMQYASKEDLLNLLMVDIASRAMDDEVANFAGKMADKVGSVGGTFGQDPKDPAYKADKKKAVALANMYIKQINKKDESVEEDEVPFEETTKTDPFDAYAESMDRIVEYDVALDEEPNEGNEFSGALAKAKMDGKEEFEVDGKTYKVKEEVDEAAKPDFLDLDGDGDKKEPMKKAAKDKKKGKEENISEIHQSTRCGPGLNRVRMRTKGGKAREFCLPTPTGSDARPVTTPSINDGGLPPIGGTTPVEPKPKPNSGWKNMFGSDFRTTAVDDSGYKMIRQPGERDPDPLNIRGGLSIPEYMKKHGIEDTTVYTTQNMNKPSAAKEVKEENISEKVITDLDGIVTYHPSNDPRFGGKPGTVPIGVPFSAIHRNPTLGNAIPPIEPDRFDSSPGAPVKPKPKPKPKPNSGYTNIGGDDDSGYTNIGGAKADPIEMPYDADDPRRAELPTFDDFAGPEPVNGWTLKQLGKLTRAYYKKYPKMNVLDQTMNEPSAAKEVKEGTWHIADDMSGLEELIASGPIPAKDAIDMIRDYIGEDDLYDAIGNLEDMDPNADARYIIKDFLESGDIGYDTFEEVQAVEEDDDIARLKKTAGIGYKNIGDVKDTSGYTNIGGAKADPTPNDGVNPGLYPDDPIPTPPTPPIDDDEYPDDLPPTPEYEINPGLYPDPEIGSEEWYKQNQLPPDVMQSQVMVKGKDGKMYGTPHAASLADRVYDYNVKQGKIKPEINIDGASTFGKMKIQKEDDMAWLRKAAGIGSGAKSNHGIHEGEEGYQITPRSLVAREMRKLQDIAKD